VIKFTINAKPIPQPRARASSIGGQVRMYEPTRTGPKGNRKPHPIVAFKDAVRDAAKEAIALPYSGAVYCALVFWMPRVTSDGKKKTGLFHTKKPDIDNLIKSVFDAMNGLAWLDDSQVVQVIALKAICDPGQEPRVDVCLDDAKAV